LIGCQTQSALVSATKLNKTYRSTAAPARAVADVSISIASGEFVAICGRSGSGKSTLLHLLGLLAEPDSGRYELNGVETSRLTDSERAAARCGLIGFVFQHAALIERASAVENVALPLIYASVPAKERRRRAEAALDRVGLRSRSAHLPRQLSGGEQQRVSIARALVNDPALILADEPTGALDSQSAEDVLALFDGLNRDGRTLCVVTHAREVAERARRLIVLRDGAVVEDPHFWPARTALV
jgi:putative ABC transport system ATP-binding protein